MNAERKIIVVLSSVILLGLCLFGYETVKAHITNVVADVKEQEGKVAAAKIAEAIRARDEAQDKYAKAVLATPVKTAQQAVQVINHYIPVAVTPNQPSKPDVIEVPKADVTPADQAQLPDSPSYVLETPELAVKTAKQLQQGDIDAHALATCISDLADSKSQTVIEHRDSQSWEKAAKGGSKWTRVLTAAKWTSVGVVVGVVVGYAAHQATQP